MMCPTSGSEVVVEIRELTDRTGVPAKTVRYYESIGLLPDPPRKANGYRSYSEADVERVRLAAGARRLDFSLAEIGEILDLRDRGEAPCMVLMDLLEQKGREIDRRIADLERLKAQLKDLHALGLTFPTDDVEGKNCVCHLVKEQAEVADDQ